MGVNENVAAVRANAGPLSQEFFLFFFEMFPAQKEKFPLYAGKDAAAIKAELKFGEHVGKVVGMILDIVEKVDDAGALKDYGSKVAKMPQHSKLVAQDYKDVFTALVAFLQKKLGGDCDTAGWESAAGKIVAAIQ